MSEEQPKYANEFEFLQALGKERYDALTEIGIDPKALNDASRAAVIGMEPKAIRESYPVWKGVFKAEKQNVVSRRVYQGTVIAVLIAAAYLCLALADGWLSEQASFLNAFAFTVEGLVVILLIDLAFPQYDLYDILTTDKKYGFGFVGYIVALYCVGAISGAGSISLGAGAVNSPKESVQEQSSGLGQHATDSLVQASKTPLRYSGSDKEEQSRGKAERLE